MPKPHNSFAEGLHKLAADIAGLELAPDADASLIQALREPILAYMKQGSSGSPQAGQASPAAPSPSPQGMPVPMPTTEGDMSRGPTPNPDMSGAVSELQRVMAGS